MASINEVKIKNFKILKNVSVKLSNLTLLTGTNSSGKSTFIQALLLIAQNKQLISLLSTLNMIRRNIKGEDSAASIEERFLSGFGSRAINVNGNLLKLGDVKDVFHQDSYKEDIEFKFISDIENIVFNIESGTLNLSIDVLDSKESMSFSGFPEYLHLLQYLHTNRIQPQNTYDLSSTVVNNGFLGVHGEFTAHYLDENRHKDLHLNVLMHPDATTSQLLENVSLWLGEISKGVAVKAKKYAEIQKASLSFQYTYGDTTSNEYSPLNVGFGLTYVLPIIVALLKAKPKELIIIENPESHLHPQGQAKIAKLCALAAEAGVQLIIESHSDHFLNALRVATKQGLIKPEHSQIHYFSKNHEQLAAEVHSLSIDAEGRINEDWPDGFFDEYGKQLDELLW